MDAVSQAVANTASPSGTVFGASLGTITDRTSASRGNQAGRPSRGTEPTADRASARTWFTARLDHPACVIQARGWMTLTWCPRLVRWFAYVYTTAKPPTGALGKPGRMNDTRTSGRVHC